MNNNEDKQRIQSAKVTESENQNGRNGTSRSRFPLLNRFKMFGCIRSDRSCSDH